MSDTLFARDDTLPMVPVEKPLLRGFLTGTPHRRQHTAPGKSKHDKQIIDLPIETNQS